MIKNIIVTGGWAPHGISTTANARDLFQIALQSLGCLFTPHTSFPYRVCVERGQRRRRSPPRTCPDWGDAPAPTADRCVGWPIGQQVGHDVRLAALGTDVGCQADAVQSVKRQLGHRHRLPACQVIIVRSWGWARVGCDNYVVHHLSLSAPDDAAGTCHVHRDLKLDIDGSSPAKRSAASKPSRLALTTGWHRSRGPRGLEGVATPPTPMLWSSRLVLAHPRAGFSPSQALTYIPARSSDRCSVPKFSQLGDKDNYVCSCLCYQTDVPLESRHASGC